MTTQLIQAAQQALDAFDAFGEADDFATLFTLTKKMNALRTAIQQAEAKTDEPVAWMWKFEGEEGAAFSSKEPTLSIRDGVNYVPLYTNTAPGVPDDVVRDAERYRWLRDHGTVGFSSGPAWQVCVSFNSFDASAQTLDANIDAAIAASQAQKG